MTLPFYHVYTENIEKRGSIGVHPIIVKEIVIVI